MYCVNLHFSVEINQISKDNSCNTKIDLYPQENASSSMIHSELCPKQ